MSEDFQRDNKELLEEVERLKSRIRELETDKNLPSAAKIEQPVEITPIDQADVTLRRLVQRIAMILQAEKIVIMFHDREMGDLKGIPPAFGVDEAHLNSFKVRATHGISGKVFRDGDAMIYDDIETVVEAREEPFGLMHVTNGVCVPLVIEKRDDENRVVEKNTIGVLHAFNKKHGETFNEEDVRLLERMARNVGSIIANLQMYREIVEEKEELAQTFESLTAGLMLVSTDRRLLQINATARAIFQAPQDSLGKAIDEIVHDAAFVAAIDKAIGGAEAGKVETHITIGGTERIYESQFASVLGQDGKGIGVVAILADVTEIRNIDRMKSSFVAMASHELRTPLTAIKGFSSTLLEGLDDELYGKEDQREFLGIVVGECDRLRRLIDDLLNTSRIEAGESLKPNYTHVDIKTLLDKVQKVQQQATTKHAIKLDIQTPLPDLIVGDEDKLDQILTNLLNNAIKYAPNGGDVTIHAKADGDTLEIGVKDQGLGIPKDHLTKVFERFHRVNNEDNRKIYGTGLGLFLVKHLVDQVHFGKIWVESELGKGSDFIFRIPTNINIEEAKKAND
ncbi:MAG: GAF domain-containing protein [Armatimonadetes bacterium]|nr:GAF domain-containing protein [Armatimonadota bacterium]MBS1702759.1 GAF domain-containing protein [Armatimonadota bacterium]MBS1727569.1 GAF domain-containing protein [Armatimonadota bacterium]